MGGLPLSTGNHRPPPRKNRRPGAPGAAGSSLVTDGGVCKASECEGPGTIVDEVMPLGCDMDRCHMQHAVESAPFHGPTTLPEGKKKERLMLGSNQRPPDALVFQSIPGDSTSRCLRNSRTLWPTELMSPNCFPF